MLRYNHIPSRFRPAQLVEHEPDRDLDDTRIVDDSNYVPNKAAEQILGKQRASQILSSLSGLFDRPEDIASGAVNLLARCKGIDIAEISQHAERLKASIEKQVRLAQRQQQRQNSRQQSPRPGPKPSGDDPKDAA